jgi:uncharacterized protein YecE (DUF72 family)
MLELYAQHFRSVEIDSSYYRVPAAASIESMVRRTPQDFRFTAKLPGTGTHLPQPGNAPVHDDIFLFRRNLTPMIEAGKLACVLAQFPNSFRPNDATRAYLAQLRDALPDLELCAEFRHREWQTNDTIELLQSRNIGLVNVDQPHFKTLMRESSDTTSSVAYIRFHGRNVENWWRGTNETRYDYLYSPEELLPWVNRIIDITANPDVREVFAFFNNHRRGQAVKNAEMLIEMLAERVPDLAPLNAHPEGAEPALELPGIIR